MNSYYKNNINGKYFRVWNTGLIFKLFQIKTKQYLDGGTWEYESYEEEIGAFSSLKECEDEMIK